jgi:hypothetical protein
MSTINTNGISVNYPVPGVNNNSQGFRDNFASIKTNLDLAGSEISDLQNKVIVKSALANTVINNDMNGTLMSNALTRSFKATTYDLGNDLSGTVSVDVTLGDVQYGSITGNTTLQFTGWVAGSQNNVELQLTVANADSTLFFTSPGIDGSACFGASTLENYDSANNAVTIPNLVCQLDYRLSTIDCGGNITIEPVNRPRRSTQIRTRTPAPTGLPGDIAGTVAVDANYAYVCTATFDSGGSNTWVKTSTATTITVNEVTLNNVTGLVTDAPIVFTGTTFGGIVANTTYYIKAIVGGNSAVTLSDARTAGTAGSVFVLSTDSGSMTATCYTGSDIWKRIALTSW